MKTQAIQPRLRFVDDNGVALVGGKVYTYAAGTTTPQSTWTDSTGNTANANPVILDARGEADIWIGELSYKFVVKDSSDNQIDVTDNITGDLYSQTANGSANTGWTLTGSSTLRTVDVKLQEAEVSIKDMGATTSGDATAAIQAVIDLAKVYGRTIKIPNGAPFQHTGLDLSGITAGLKFRGEGNPGGSTIGNCAGLRYTSSGTGNAISIGSSLGIEFENVAFSYNHTGFTGKLISCTQTAALDTGLCVFENCLFTGEGSAINASALLYLDECFTMKVKGGVFRYADVGILTGSSSDGVNVLLIDGPTFQVNNVGNIVFNGAGGHQSVSIMNCTFEPLVNGKAAGLTMAAGAGFIMGFLAKGNWFGDVTVNGGLYWMRLQNCYGGEISGNFFGTPGAGASDYAILLSTSRGLYVGGNRFDAKALSLPDNSSGIEFTNNDVPAGDSAVSSSAAVPPTLRNNIGMTDTNGGVFRIAGGSSPYISFMPGSGATAEFALVQNADQVYFQDKTNAANRLQYGVITGAFYPATPAGVNQTAVAIYAGSGAPNNANGADGSIYFRSDGGAGTTVYHKVGGAWTGRA